MSENLDSPVPDSIGPITELPTAEGTSLSHRRLVANRYEILSRLGKGGMGEVWRAYDLKLRVDVALKSLHRTTSDSVEALRREVRSAREVISPNVCRIFDLVVEEDREWISMEYIDGLTLTSMLVKKGALELREARDIAAQFLAGLEAIHKAGLVHRDLKPENIMITRTGRVVVMDFGIAKQVAQLGGTIAGTVPYMSPEQLAGERIDARSDVFSAGVVLAEMIHPAGVYSQKTREEIWNAIRKTPLQIPDSPWKTVIAKAVANDPADRFSSAGAFSRALEEVTLRVETIEEPKPYPGLASFSAADAEYFFGRELEVETLIKKLQQLHLLALIGPSGAGKTSFLRAGLIPALPQNMDHVFCTPGDSPVIALSQALVPKFSGDVEAIQLLLRFEDVSAAIDLMRRWKSRHPEVLLVIDRFEELFTLNSPEAQSRYVEVIGRAALEADVRVLLVMRDDFLFHCHHHPGLAPIFSELTPLGTLTGTALRRALVQPALKCGYRFEDETLVDEIIADIEQERGALPLMAFAASRLWDKRDRQSGTLTRQAYREIGGVAGALAQHAEQTMERIGSERQPIVREIFRNLITAQNTRAARDTDELLSVFASDSVGRPSLAAGTKAAGTEARPPGVKVVTEEVLRILIDARLLTSFETTEGENRKSRVEIIHESLLTNWPRLVRWQTQDADSAQLRDQLRQAAQLWEQRNRSQDLLWTGASYLEFQAWRQRYPGGLTTTEEAFAQAMTHRATTSRRQRRIMLAAAFAIIVAIAVTLGMFWHRSEVSLTKAEAEARRAEASKLLALGRNHLETNPSTALAYAISSLELVDTSQARLFALQSLSKGPPALYMDLPIRNLTYHEFSPDGQWLVAGGWAGVRLIPRDGSTPYVLSDYLPDQPFARWPFFSPDGSLVVWSEEEMIRVWSVIQKKEIRTFPVEGRTLTFRRGNRALFITELSSEKKIRFRSWEFDEQKPKVIGDRDWHVPLIWDIDPKAQWLAYQKGNEIRLHSFQDIGTIPDHLVGGHEKPVRAITFDPTGNLLASSDGSEIRLWSVHSPSMNLLRAIPIKEAIEEVQFDRSGSFLVAYFEEGAGRKRIWDLKRPAVEPVYSGLSLGFLDFDPKYQWVSLRSSERLAFHSLAHTYPYIYRSESSASSRSIRFMPDGKSIISAFQTDRKLQTWPVYPNVPTPSGFNRWKLSTEFITRIDIDSQGRQVIVGTHHEGAVLVRSDGTELHMPRILAGTSVEAVALSRDGRFVAAACTTCKTENLGIEVWDIESGKVRVLKESKGKSVGYLKFSPDGRLLSSDILGNLLLWNLSDDAVQTLRKGTGYVPRIAVSNSGRYVATTTMLSVKNPSEYRRATSEVTVYDLEKNISWPIRSHGNRAYSVAFDSEGKTLVTGDIDGVLRVGPITGEAPHLLIGDEDRVDDVAVHPGGEWIASTDYSRPVIRLWPMPKGKPFHTLPYEDFLSRLRALTNMRIVKDENSTTGYSSTLAPFPGWEKVPTW
jgi:serine/threonine protein kinase/WD40 repeat protein